MHFISCFHAIEGNILMSQVAGFSYSIFKYNGFGMVYMVYTITVL